MIKVTFKNLEPSELAREATLERIESIIEKFEFLSESRIHVSLAMDNSPAQKGPDLFEVKVQVNGGRYNGVRIAKSASSLYIALADVVDHMLEVLNRFSDKTRVRERSDARKVASRAARQP